METKLLQILYRALDVRSRNTQKWKLGHPNRNKVVRRLAIKHPATLSQKKARVVSQEQKKIAVMHVHPLIHRRLATRQSRLFISVVRGIELGDFNTLPTILNLGVIQASLPQDDTGLCALHRVGFAREISLKKFKLSQGVVIAQLSSHERSLQGRREAINRLHMVGDGWDRAAARPEKIFVIGCPIRRLVGIRNLEETRGWPEE